MGLYITGLGMLLSFVLALYSRLHFRGNIYLAIFFFLFNLEEFAIDALHVEKYPVIAAVMLYHFAPLFFLIGPAFYLYSRSIITNSARLYKKDLWHLLPVIVTFIVLWKYYFWSFDHKISLAVEISKGIQAYLFGFRSIIPQAYINLLRAISILGYISYAAWIFYRNLPQIRSHSLLRPKQRQSVELWLRVTFICTITLSFIYLLASIQLVAFNKIDIVGPNHFIIPLIYMALNIILLFCPQILYGLLSHVASIDDIEDQSVAEKPENTKNNGTPDLLLFTDEYIDEIERKLKNVVMQKEYCNLDLSRSKLSNLTGIPLHHLSYYFSNILNIKFTDWRNQLRVDHAKKLISSETMKTMTLDAIANQCGFGNRQNFIASFKKMTSMTPSEYLNSTKK
ncbi:helix-turn-helix domain-containing protein [Paludibacter sp.]|uniref:AraC family transcriptional regulator n=1 Tax=Paludibacter sp. TaxID=1898105 RepID=UPI001354C2D8|nr:helix-turn-helix domain-containing protein [Paludibacter sp.]MTK53235.1 AraC family transcriptional regulator [Paludibacter sp.]